MLTLIFRWNSCNHPLATFKPILHSLVSLLVSLKPYNYHTGHTDIIHPNITVKCVNCSQHPFPLPMLTHAHTDGWTTEGTTLSINEPPVSAMVVWLCCKTSHTSLFLPWSSVLIGRDYICVDNGKHFPLGIRQVNYRIRKFPHRPGTSSNMQLTPPT